MKVLVIEDEAALRRTLGRALREEGYVVEETGEGAEALLWVRHTEFDLIVLDVMLPQVDGWEILRAVRKRGDTPVLMLTARDAVADRVRGLDLGSDDYLVKPFELPELLARVRALVRRAARQPQPAIDLGDGLELDTVGRQARRGGEVVELTAKEYALLEWLVRQRGRVVPREVLYEHLFPEDHESTSNLLDVYVCNLRRKLGREVVQTRRGLGYTIPCR